MTTKTILAAKLASLVPTLAHDSLLNREKTIMGMLDELETDVAIVKHCDAGRWFYAEYGYSVVVGQCVARVRNDGYMLRFRWGNPYRTVQLVEVHRILGEAQDPRWLSKIWRTCKMIKDEVLKDGRK